MPAGVPVGRSECQGSFDGRRHSGTTPSTEPIQQLVQAVGGERRRERSAFAAGAPGISQVNGGLVRLTACPERAGRGRGKERPAGEVLGGRLQPRNERRVAPGKPLGQIGVRRPPVDQPFEIAVVVQRGGSSGRDVGRRPPVDTAQVTYQVPQAPLRTGGDWGLRGDTREHLAVTTQCGEVLADGHGVDDRVSVSHCPILTSFRANAAELATSSPAPPWSGRGRPWALSTRSRAGRGRTRPRARGPSPPRRSRPRHRSADPRVRGTHRWRTARTQ